MDNFSQKLKVARADTGLSQRKLAETIGVSRRNIENWESGSRVPDEFKQECLLKEIEKIQKNT